MSESGHPKETPVQPWPEDYPKWYIDLLESSIEETGMSRKEAENYMEHELMFGGSLMQGYVNKLKAHQKDTKRTESQR